MTIEFPVALFVIATGALAGSGLLFLISYRVDKLMDILEKMDTEDRIKFYETRFQRELKRKNDK
jgi:hypothetical protein